MQIFVTCMDKGNSIYLMSDYISDGLNTLVELENYFWHLTRTAPLNI